MNNTPNRLIFSHIPKCGGSTFGNILKSIYTPEQVYGIYPAYNETTLNGLIDATKAPDHDIKLIMGHFPFGIHNHLNKDLRESPYITFLRDPIERVISLYSYVKRTKTDALYETIKDMSLREFIESDINAQVDNFQTRYVSGITHGISFGNCNSDMVDKAIDNLNSSYISFGLMERFDESLILFKHALEWERIPYFRKHNVSKEKPEINQKIVDLIAERNQFDAQLYNKGKVLFQEKIDMIRTFKDDLNSFHKESEAYWEGYYDSKKRFIHDYSKAGIKTLSKELFKRIKQRIR